MRARNRFGGRGSRNLPEKRKPASEEIRPAGKPTFAELLRQIAAETGKASLLRPEPAPLAGLDYASELELKNAALRRLWDSHGLPDKPSRVIPSPAPRHYRSTSKRRVAWRNNHWEWDFFPERKSGPALPHHWDLETPQHQAVYHKALEKLREPAYQSLARSLNCLIVRGEADLLVLINVHRLNAEVVRKAHLLAEHLQAIPEAKIVSARLFFDPTQSKFYLEASPQTLKLKKLFGPDWLPITVANWKYFLHPAGFFQINPFLLPRLVEDVVRTVKPQKTDRLLDLYCGCGLFSVPLAEACGQTIGVELSAESCEAARKSALAAGVAKARFFASGIEPDRLARFLPPPDTTPEVMLLDPPRQGTAPGLIRALAERHPRRVAHLFCDMNTMAAEIDRWRRQGYMVAKVTPYDMFPGTEHLEVLVLLLPDRFGLLGRKPSLNAVTTSGKNKDRF